MRLVRAEMLEVLRTDYIKFARARGLTDRAVHFGHALKNTLVPVITITGLQLGALIAFAIITETVFQWPGMGLLFIQAVQFADIPVMAAYLCLIALIFVLINLVVDLLYFAVDPRLRIERGAARRWRCDADAPAAASADSAAPRALDSDVWYSFVARRWRSSRRVIAADRRRLRRCSPLDRAAQPVRPGDARPQRRALMPPAWVERRRLARYLLGTDDQGRDILSALMYGARISLVVGLRLGAAVAGARRRARPAVAAIVGGAARRVHHARLRRAALVPGDPDRAADRRRRARALSRASAHDDDRGLRADPRDRARRLGAVRAHRARLDAGRDATRNTCRRRA